MYRCTLHQGHSSKTLPSLGGLAPSESVDGSCVVSNGQTRRPVVEAGAPYTYEDMIGEKGAIQLPGQ